MPSSRSSLMSSSPTHDMRVGIQSSIVMNSPVLVPAGILSFHFTSIGTRNPPSQPPAPFSPWKGWLPPSGHELQGAPLSVENITMVLSATLSSSSWSSNSPTSSSNSIIPSAYRPYPLLPSYSSLRLVR